MDCAKCPYRVVEAAPEHLREQVGSDEWESCDIDKIGIDAADRLTAVLGELERVTRERDAAVESWKGFCAKCAWNGKQYLSDGKMDTRCKTCREGGKCNWQWRGPKEAET